MPLITTVSNSIPVSSQNHIHTSLQNSQNQQAFVIPWHSIVPLLTAPGSISPPPTELSPPLSASFLTTQVPAPVLDIIDDEDNPEPIPVIAEEDDDVFEPGTPETPTCITDNLNCNKRRSQSLSALPNNPKDVAKVG